MASMTVVPASPVATIPLQELLPWAIFAGLILLLAIYFVGTEQGATSTPEALETEVLLCWGAAAPFVD